MKNGWSPYKSVKVNKKFKYQHLGEMHVLLFWKFNSVIQKCKFRILRRRRKALADLPGHFYLTGFSELGIFFARAWHGNFKADFLQLKGFQPCLEFIKLESPAGNSGLARKFLFFVQVP